MIAPALGVVVLPQWNFRKREIRNETAINRIASALRKVEVERRTPRACCRNQEERRNQHARNPHLGRCLDEKAGENIITWDNEYISRRNFRLITMHCLGTQSANRRSSHEVRFIVV